MLRKLYKTPFVLILLVGLLLPANNPVVQAAPAAYDCTVATGLPLAECEALVAIYEANGGAYWYNKTGWLYIEDPCSWYGVTCADGHVTRLELPCNSLLNTLPLEIGNLTALTHLDLGSRGACEHPNYLNPLPPTIGNLTALKILDLSRNSMTVLPAGMGNLTALTALNLSATNLTVLPPEIGNLTALVTLNLSSNHLSSLPSFIENFAALRELDLSYNSLTGLPPEIGHLTTLTKLNLMVNPLSTLPPEIGYLQALAWLDLSAMNLSALPPEIGNLSYLSYLDLSDNELTVLPSPLVNLSRLTELDLSHNSLTLLPAGWGNLTSLTSHSLQHNPLTVLPPEIGSLSGLVYLDLSHTALTTLPPEIGNLSALESLTLSDNPALTALPPEINNLGMLKFLYLSGDTALRSLPADLSRLRLGTLDMSHCGLTSLPPAVCGVSAERLDLSFNSLTTLPPEIGNLPATTALDLNNNALVALPPEIGNVTTLTYLALHKNPLRGEIPAFLTSLTNLSTFIFYDTQWCIPPAGSPVSLWLSSIPFKPGTGIVCGQATGGLSGIVTLPNGIPAPGIQVRLFRAGPYQDRNPIATTQTGADGVYSFGNLGQDIIYLLQFVDPLRHYRPEYYGDTPTLWESTPVTVTLGMTRTGIDVELSPIAINIVKSVKPAMPVANGSRLIYTVEIQPEADVSLHFFDPIGSHLTWLGFVGDAPDGLIYADGAITGTVMPATWTPWKVSYAVRVNVPESSFLDYYVQVISVVYYYYLDEPPGLARSSNPVITSVSIWPINSIFLPTVSRNF